MKSFTVQSKGFTSLVILVTLTIISTLSIGSYIAIKKINNNSSNNLSNSTVNSSSNIKVSTSSADQLNISSSLTASSPLPTPLPTPSSLAKPSTSPKPTYPTPAQTNNNPNNGYSYITVSTTRGNFSAHVVKLPSSAKMITDTASDSDCPKDCPTLPLAEYINRNGGIAGINGTYFCPASYSECSEKKDSFDFSVYNTRLNKWINQGQLSWNGRSIIYMDGSGMHYLQGANSFSGGLTAGIVNYPGILNNGQITIEDPSLSAKQSSKGTKGGLGMSSSNIYLVIASNVDMYDFAHIFKSLGATHALNLDGGGSVALWYGGYKVGPGRNLPNAIIFK